MQHACSTLLSLSLSLGYQHQARVILEPRGWAVYETYKERVIESGTGKVEDLK